MALTIDTLRKVSVMAQFYDVSRSDFSERTFRAEWQRFEADMRKQGKWKTIEAMLRDAA